jgi:hypothetical protein
MGNSAGHTHTDIGATETATASASPGAGQQTNGYSTPTRPAHESAERLDDVVPILTARGCENSKKDGSTIDLAQHHCQNDRDQGTETPKALSDWRNWLNYRTSDAPTSLQVLGQNATSEMSLVPAAIETASNLRTDAEATAAKAKTETEIAQTTAPPTHSTGRSGMTPPRQHTKKLLADSPHPLTKSPGFQRARSPAFPSRNSLFSRSLPPHMFRHFGRGSVAFLNSSLQVSPKKTPPRQRESLCEKPIEAVEAYCQDFSALRASNSRQGVNFIVKDDTDSTSNSDGDVNDTISHARNSPSVCQGSSGAPAVGRTSAEVKAAGKIGATSAECELKTTQEHDRVARHKTADSKSYSFDGGPGGRRYKKDLGYLQAICGRASDTSGMWENDRSFRMGLFRDEGSETETVSSWDAEEVDAEEELDGSTPAEWTWWGQTIQARRDERLTQEDEVRRGEAAAAETSEAATAMMRDRVKLLLEAKSKLGEGSCDEGSGLTVTAWDDAFVSVLHDGARAFLGGNVLDGECELPVDCLAARLVCGTIYACAEHATTRAQLAWCIRHVRQSTRKIA